jgi:hypothetical protein
MANIMRQREINDYKKEKAKEKHEAKMQYHMKTIK